MKRALPLILLVIAATAYAEAGDLLTVTRVIDGDTVVVRLPNDKLETIRLIGTDTPEYHHSKKLRRDAERSHQDIETIREIGKKASAFTSALLLGKKVSLEYDQTRTDRYGRTLAYLILPDGKNANLKKSSDGAN